jgi:hypothetical protein
MQINGYFFAIYSLENGTKCLQITNKAMGYGKKKNQGRVVRPWFIREIF